MKNIFLISKDIFEIGSKKKAISVISNILSKQLKISPEDIEKSIYEREKNNGTAIISEIAIPHIIINKMISPCMAVFVLHPSCKDWICLDNSKVRILICLISCKKMSIRDSKLREIKNIFKNIGKDDYIEQLKEKNSAKQIAEFLEK